MTAACDEDALLVTLRMAGATLLYWKKDNYRINKKETKKNDVYLP
jgi:hypothetical protein